MLSLVWIVAGVVAFLGWARYQPHWPFAPKEIREVFLAEQRAHPDQVAVERGAQWADS